jgi:TPR repeat protein
MFWPGSPDVAGGYYWVSKAADQQFPPAMFALGVRLKYGEHVPKPQNWTDTGGNVFPQLQSGQTLIDRAHALGFKEPVHEELYYWECFRR